MKKNFYLKTIFFCLALFINSCDKPFCDTPNPIFNKYQPNTQEYKAELAKQLSLVDKNKLTFWFFEYVQNNGNELLYFDVQGDGLCAKIELKVEKWEKLEELRQKKGVSFRGAEFVNLKFDIIQDSAKTEFIYKTFDKLID